MRSADISQDPQRPTVMPSGRVTFPDRVDKWPVVERRGLDLRRFPDGLAPDVVAAAQRVRIQAMGVTAPALILEDGSAVIIGHPGEDRFPQWTSTGIGKEEPTANPSPAARNRARMAKTGGGPASGERPVDPQEFRHVTTGEGVWDTTAQASLEEGGLE